MVNAYADDPVDQADRRAQDRDKAAEKAQIIILLSDEKSPFPDIQEKEHQHIIYVINKSDKLKLSYGEKTVQFKDVNDYLLALESKREETSLIR